MTNNEELLKIIIEYEFANKDLANMTDYAIDTVKAWRSPIKGNKHRIMPDRAMKLLKFEIKDRKLRRKKQT